MVDGDRAPSGRIRSKNAPGGRVPPDPTAWSLRGASGHSGVSLRPRPTPRHVACQRLAIIALELRATES